MAKFFPMLFSKIEIQVLGSLQEQREAIAELRSMIEYQVRLGSSYNSLDILIKVFASFVLSIIAWQP